MRAAGPRAVSIKRGNKFPEQQFFLLFFFLQHKLLLYLLPTAHQTRRLYTLSVAAVRLFNQPSISQQFRLHLDNFGSLYPL